MPGWHIVVFLWWFPPLVLNKKQKSYEKTKSKKKFLTRSQHFTTSESRFYQKILTIFDCYSVWIVKTCSDIPKNHSDLILGVFGEENLLFFGICDASEHFWRYLVPRGLSGILRLLLIVLNVLWESSWYFLCLSLWFCDLMDDID